MKISIVTCSYNQARFVEETLRSVRFQEYRNCEHILIDGGSTDGSLDIIRKYEDQFSYCVSEPDGGHTRGLIKGFAHATGDILCWLNSDDLFEPWTLREVAQFFTAHPEANVVYGDSQWITAEGEPIKPKKEHAFNRFIWTYDYNFIPQPSTFWRRSLYDEVGGLDPSFQLAMDADLWIRFADRTPLHHVRRPWSKMRLYAEQRNQKLRARSDEEDRLMRRRYIGAEPAWSLRTKWMAAKGTRIAWKLATGCYW